VLATKFWGPMGDDPNQGGVSRRWIIAEVENSLRRLNERGIQTGVSWIIGYPNESRASMLATLEWAARIKYLFPNSPSDIFPFRPIPGTEDFDAALKLGYVPPKDFHDWGKCFEYKYNSHNTPLPEDVRETWRLYNNTAAIYDKHVTEGPMWMRNALSRAAGWRLKTGRYKFPIEQKVFDLYVKATGQTQPGAVDYQPAIDA